MSIVSEVKRLKDAKTAIQTAIEGKGVTVPDATMLEGMAALIDSIEAGGGIDTGDFFSNPRFASIIPSEDMSVCSGLYNAGLTDSAYTISDIAYVVAKTEYRITLGDNYIRLAFWPLKVYKGIWRILYGTGTTISSESWTNVPYTSGKGYYLKAGIPYEMFVVSTN